MPSDVSSLMKLNADQIDTLTETVNIGVGHAAGTLNSILDSHMQIKIPGIQVVSHQKLRENLPVDDNEPLHSVRMRFKGPLSGAAAIAFPPDSALNLVSILTAKRPGLANFCSFKRGTLSEVGNIILNGVMVSIENMLKKNINYSLPVYLEEPITKLTRNDNDLEGRVFLAKAGIFVEKRMITGYIVISFEGDSFYAFMSALDMTNLTPWR